MGIKWKRFIKTSLTLVKCSFCFIINVNERSWQTEAWTQDKNRTTFFLWRTDLTKRGEGIPGVWPDIGSQGPSRVRRAFTEGTPNSKRVKALAVRRGHLHIPTYVYISFLALSTERALKQDILVEMSNLVPGWLHNITFLLKRTKGHFLEKEFIWAGAENIEDEPGSSCSTRKQAQRMTGKHQKAKRPACRGFHWQYLRHFGYQI